MKFLAPSSFTKVALVVSIVVLLDGCSLPAPRAMDRQHDHVYIKYWPPAEPRGLRLAVKDLIDMKGEVTTAGSEFLLKHSPPAPRDAACLAIARERKVQIVGKTNTTELAVGVAGINQYFGTPWNPLSTRRQLVPGGSSSGSAVAVANGTADVAFGTDTAGSIRVPAACCGVFGLKTTFGLVPLRGIYPVAPNQLDTVGPLAKDVPRLVEGMELLERGFASKYAAARAAHPSAARIRVGRLYIPGTDPRIDRAIDDVLAARGFHVVKLDDRFQELWKRAEGDGKTVAAVCAWIYDEKFAKESEVRPRTKAVCTVGHLEYQTAYPPALQRQPEWQAELRRLFKTIDFIALPTLTTLPPHVPLLGGTVAFELSFSRKQNTAAVNFGGTPAIAIPVPVQSANVPVTSLQLVGPRSSEAQLVNAARLISEPPRAP